MPYKQLRAWEDKFYLACSLASLYNCSLSVDQFLASNAVEPEERQELIEHFAHVGIEF